MEAGYYDLINTAALRHIYNVSEFLASNTGPDPMPNRYLTAIYTEGGRACRALTAGA